MKTLLLQFCIIIASSVYAQKGPEIGIVEDMEQDSLLYAAGYRSLSESIQKCFSPRKLNDEQYQIKMKQMEKLKTKVVACNLFMPGDMKLVGPTVDEKAILEYVEVVFQRYQKAGLKMIVWGSGGARQVPKDFDREKAKDQFVSIGRKVAERAKKYNITLALESLNSTECNFLNLVSETYEIAKRVDHPNFRLNADFYHMLKENEGPEIIVKAGKYIAHCEIAERDGRTPPGTHGQDFTAYLKAMKKIKYKGRIILECRWENLAKQATDARIALQKQIDVVY